MVLGGFIVFFASSSSHDELFLVSPFGSSSPSVCSARGGGERARSYTLAIRIQSDEARTYSPAEERYYASI